MTAGLHARRSAGVTVVFAAAAHAATPAPPAGTVTVVGQRPELVDGAEAKRFVAALGIAAGDRQVARWRDPVCPRVLGLSPELAGRVEARIRAAARDARASLAADPCRPNLLVSFTGDARGFMRAVARASPRSLGELDAAARERLVHGVAPIRWWRMTGTEGGDGREEQDGPPVAAPAGGEGGTSVLPGRSLSAYTTSLIATDAVRVIKRATVVVDAALAAGAPLDAVADYVALVALAEVQPADPPPARSILALFEPGRAVRGLGEADRALLAALYAMPLDRAAAGQRGALVRRISAARR